MAEYLLRLWHASIRSIIADFIRMLAIRSIIADFIRMLAIRSIIADFIRMLAIRSIMDDFIGKGIVSSLRVRQLPGTRKVCAYMFVGITAY